MSKIKPVLEGGLCLFLALLLVALCTQKYSGKAMPTIFGWGQATVVSGSMEPVIHVGSMILVQENAEYEPGDIVVYLKDSGELIVHRLISVTGDFAITKGDANATEDDLIRTAQILGTVETVIPVLGQVVLWLGEPWVIGAVIAIAAVFWVLPSALKRRNTKSPDNENEGSD